MEVENSPCEPISSPQYGKMLNFAKSCPQYPKRVNFAKSPPLPPMLNIDLHPCQSSVILVTFFKSHSTDQKTSSILVLTPEKKGGEPMARVPDVARRRFFSGTPRDTLILISFFFGKCRTGPNCPHKAFLYEDCYFFH